MYPRYFGLKEPSFSIAPDPHYLYLSEQHKEALAHLLYGAGESGGFVLLTGEVGTGKTTVCRAFLEQLPGDVDVALILNPTQSANELLLNICEELRIEVPSGKRSNKLLIDRLNRYLLEVHARGRRPLLIIDEAQNLRPEVMEQIRLLTNLETTKHKLLQIFLIGQPELRRLLEGDRLRQLNQRITARFHLTPLGLRETGSYIRHRIAVGGVERPLFTARAIRLIYKQSGGIPRLINILCDRALLGASVTRSPQVTPAIVAKAAREVRGEPIELAAAGRGGLAILMVLSFLLALGIGWSGYHLLQGEGPAFLAGLLPRPETASPQSPAAKSLPETAGPASEEPVTEGPTESESTDLPSSAAAPEPEEAATGEAVTGTGGSPAPPLGMASVAPEVLEPTLGRLAFTEETALRLLLRRWGLQTQDLGAGDPCVRLQAFGLACQREQGSLANVRFFGLPALLRVAEPGGAGRFLVLGGLGATVAELDLPEGSERLSIEALEHIWSGDYLLVWQLPPGGSDVIGPRSSGENVRWLRAILAKIPDLGAPLGESSRFDADLGTALRAFQTSRGLQPDGLAGARTLIQLHQAVGMPGVPRLEEVD